MGKERLLSIEQTKVKPTFSRRKLIGDALVNIGYTAAITGLGRSVYESQQNEDPLTPSQKKSGVLIASGVALGEIGHRLLKEDKEDK